MLIFEPPWKFYDGGVNDHMQIDWLQFNGSFITIRPNCAFEGTSIVYCKPLNFCAPFIFAGKQINAKIRGANIVRSLRWLLSLPTITEYYHYYCNASRHYRSQNAKFKGSKYVSMKKPQYKRARENLGVYSIVSFLWNAYTLEVLYISYSVVEDQWHKWPPRFALFFVHNGP